MSLGLIGSVSAQTGGPNSVFTVPVPAADVAFDPVRPYAYVSGYDSKTLFVLNLSNGVVEAQFSFSYNPESIAIAPNGQRMYVALLRRPHSPYWFGGHTNYIAEFDLAQMTKTKEFMILADPGDLAVTDSGILVVPGGSDQWTDIRTYRTSDGGLVDSRGIRQSSRVSLDASQRAVYTADTDQSPSAIERYDFDPVTGSFLSTWGSLYWGDHPMNGNVWCFPSGTNVVTRGAGLYSSSAVQAQDMLYMTTLTGGTIEGVDFDPVHNAFFTVGASGLCQYNLSTFLLTYTFTTTNGTRYVQVRNRDLYVAWPAGTNTYFQWMQNPALPDPLITQQPQSQTVIAGGSAAFSIQLRGQAPFGFQWFFQNNPLAGETNQSLVRNPTQPNHEGDYIVQVTNSYGSATSIVAHLTVLVLPSITGLSPNTNVLAGQSFSLSVASAGTAPFTYRWMFEDANISGGSNQTLTVNNAQAAHEGIYRVAVANAAGSVTSAPVSVRVLPAAPLIVSNPVPLIVAASSNATFGVSAMGSQPLAYQWFLQGAPIAGATAAQYALGGAQSINSGAYKVVVANSMGSATSAVATLTVTALAPYFITQPVGAALSTGSSRTLTGLANGSQPIGYQWQRNGTTLAGAIQTSLVLTNLAGSDSGLYTLVASNIAGVSTSAVAQITVYQTPTLAQALTNQVADVNNTVVLTVSALGSPTLVYSWQLNGKPIAGSSPTLLLSNVQPAQSGYYRVTVTNQYGSVSSAGRVSVLGWPSGVTTWGDDSGGQTNVPANLNDIVAVAGGDYHSVALHHDGTLIAWGYNGDGQSSVPTNALRFVTVASGAGHSLAITENGGVVAWGRNDAGQRTVPAGASNSVLAVAGGDAHSLALLSSGSVLAWGDSSFGQCSVPQGLSGVQAIAAGRNHSLALRTNGEVVGWGFNTYGQASAPVLSNAVAIAAGYLHSVALLSNGTVVVWGDNTFGQANVPAGLTNLVAITAGDFHTLALRADGSVIGWGDDSYAQTNVPIGLANVSAVASGNYHGLALTPAMGVLQSSLISARLVLRWSGRGTLQWAPTGMGPYTDVGCQGTCYTNLDMSAPARFFRLRQ